MDLRTCQWHQPYLDLFKVRHSSLPRIVSNAEVYGHVREGPLAGVPIAGCLGDQQAAMLGEQALGPVLHASMRCCCRPLHAVQHLEVLDAKPCGQTLRFASAWQ